MLIVKLLVSTFDTPANAKSAPAKSMRGILSPKYYDGFLVTCNQPANVFITSIIGPSLTIVLSGYISDSIASTLGKLMNDIMPNGMYPSATIAQNALY